MLVQLSGGACTTVPRTWLSRQGWAAKTLMPGLSSIPWYKGSGHLHEAKASFPVLLTPQPCLASRIILWGPL